MSRKYKKKKEDSLDVSVVLMALISFMVWINTDNMILAITIFSTGMIALISIILSIRKYKKEKRNKVLIDSGIDIVDNMPGLDFEKFVLVHFEKQGYKGEVTRATHDYGADLILKKDNLKIVVQAKRWRDKVGITAIQEIVGAINYYEASKGMVITNSYFTSNAEALAKANNIDLWDRDTLIEIMAKNQGKEISEIINSEIKIDKEFCPRCNSDLVKRKGKNGLFLGCSNFPRCRFTENIDN